MKAFNLSLLILTIWLLGSCQSKKLEDSRREIISLVGLPGTELTMELVADIPSESYTLSPPDFYLVDDTLIALTDFNNASSLRFYNRVGENIGHSNIRKKTDRYALPVDPAMRTSFAFLHPNTNIFYEYVIEDGELRLDEFTRLRVYEYSPRDAVRLDEEHFAFIGMYKDGLFGLWDQPTRALTFFGSYPIEKEYYSNLLLSYFNGRINRSGNQLVYVSYQFGYISSYKYNKGRLVKLWEKQIGEYLYKENSLGLVFDKMHKNGFLEVFFAGDNIYTLYNGCDETAGEEFTNSILVFSRDGKPIARHTLPEMISYMKIDSKGEYAYATYLPNVGEVKLVRFKLP